MRMVLIVFLAIIVVGTGYWGYQEHQEKNAVLIHAENNYQRAFHDLTYQIDLLHDKLGETLAMNSRNQLSKGLVEIWRISSNAHSDVGQLPLTLLPFNKTEEFLADIGQFSYRTAVRDLEKKPLNDQEYQTLQTLYKNAAEIQQELRTVQYKVINNNLRWMDVELALASEEEQADNTIIDGFKTVEKNVEEYSETDFGPTFSEIQRNENQDFRYLTAKKISKNEVKKKAIDILQLKENSNIKVSENGEGSNYGFYSLMIDSPNQGKIYMDITKKGGYPIWIMNQREIGEQSISLNEAAMKAEKYLQKHHFNNMELFESSQYDNVGVFTFVSKMDDMRIYPDSIHVKVGLDKGDVVSFSAKEYLMSHHNRQIPNPEVTLQEALQEVSDKVDVKENRLVVIKNELGKEVLCYEILGTIDHDTYRIYINAMNSREEKVEKLKKSEPIYS